MVVVAVVVVAGGGGWHNRRIVAEDASPVGVRRPTKRPCQAVGRVRPESTPPPAAGSGIVASYASSAQKEPSQLTI
jgi:hypothetical protein